MVYSNVSASSFVDYIYGYDVEESDLPEDEEQPSGEEDEEISYYYYPPSKDHPYTIILDEEWDSSEENSSSSSMSDLSNSEGESSEDEEEGDNKNILRIPSFNKKNKNNSTAMKMEINQQANDRICSICMDEYEEQEMITVSDCQHKFCKDCMHNYTKFKTSDVHCLYHTVCIERSI